MTRAKRVSARRRPSSTSETPPDRRRRSLGEEVSRRLAARKVKTPGRALAEIEKLETAGVEEVGTPVFVWPVHLKRTTGFEVVCSDHGSMPFYAPSRRAGHLAAARHIAAEHGRKGTVVLKDRPIKVAGVTK